MSDAKWHKGPPPSVGWWPASGFQFDDIYRWWNGTNWSKPAAKRDGKRLAAYMANLPSATDDIEWQHRPASWPKRSRT